MPMEILDFIHPWGDLPIPFTAKIDYHGGTSNTRWNHACNVYETLLLRKIDWLFDFLHKNYYLMCFRQGRILWMMMPFDLLTFCMKIFITRRPYFMNKDALPVMFTKSTFLEKNWLICWLFVAKKFYLICFRKGRILLIMMPFL